MIRKIGTRDIAFMLLAIAISACIEREQADTTTHTSGVNPNLAANVPSHAASNPIHLEPTETRDQDASIESEGETTRSESDESITNEGGVAAAVPSLVSQDAGQPSPHCCASSFVDYPACEDPAELVARFCDELALVDATGRGGGYLIYHPGTGCSYFEARYTDETYTVHYWYSGAWGYSGCSGRAVDRAWYFRPPGADATVAECWANYLEWPECTSTQQGCAAPAPCVLCGQPLTYRGGAVVEVLKGEQVCTPEEAYPFTPRLAPDFTPLPVPDGGVLPSADASVE